MISLKTNIEKPSINAELKTDIIDLIIGLSKTISKYYTFEFDELVNFSEIDSVINTEDPSNYCNLERSLDCIDNIISLDLFYNETYFCNSHSTLIEEFLEFALLALKKNKKSLNSLLNHGFVFYLQERYLSAIEMFLKYISLCQRPKQIVYYFLGLCYSIEH
jgi:hypothetical protein